MPSYVGYNNVGKNEPTPITWIGAGVESRSTHAEMKALVIYYHSYRVYNLRKLKKPPPTIKPPKEVVVERNYRGKLANSRPCNECIYVMRWCGVEYVTWSTGDPDEPYKRERVSEMELLGPSKGNRN